ncbi:MAG: hypothetical protein JSV66_00005 [Trueperaceae bacterium]|nr:MAG: hypothetical protein JSV66_00005 [Trueperaceae bacterium]
MSKAVIEAFLLEMRKRHQREIDAVALPEGTLEYVRERIEQRDSETLLFMLKLGYLMGLQTGYAAGRSGESQIPPTSSTRGPLQA